MKNRIIIFLLIVICLLGYLFKDYINNAYYYMKTYNMNVDMTIEKRELKIGLTGMQNSINRYYYVDIKKKKLYNVIITKCELSCDNLHFWETKERYSIKTKKLSSEELSILLNITKVKSDIISDDDFLKSDSLFKYYYVVSLKDSNDTFIYKNDNDGIGNFERILNI